VLMFKIMYVAYLILLDCYLDKTKSRNWSQVGAPRVTIATGYVMRRIKLNSPGIVRRLWFFIHKLYYAKEHVWVIVLEGLMSTETYKNNW